MTQTTAVHLRYQPRGAAAPTELLAAVTDDQLARVTAILQNQDEPQAPPTQLPYKAAYLVDLLGKLQLALVECEAVYARENIANPIPMTHCAAVIRLSTLREVGSSPKQIASLLGCQVGYFDGEDPEVQFSLRRFAPTPGFFDLRMGDAQ